MSVQLLVILVPVIFAFMGFAFDLGRLYLIRGELQEAANAMALAAAAQLAGTETSGDNASTAARNLLNDGANTGMKYNFGGLLIGQSTGLLTSQANDPAYFTTSAGANAAESSEGDASGTDARFARVQIQADAPLLFWALFSQGAGRTTPVVATAVAGLSAPLCQACAIEPFAIAALNIEDTENFGFELNTRYTFGYQCNGQNPGGLGGPRVPFLILNPDAETEDPAGIDELQQFYKIGAQGLYPTPGAPTRQCLLIQAETPVSVWASAAPGNCNTLPQPVRATACGVYSRFDAAVPDACAVVPEIDTLSAAYVPDTFLDEFDDYTAYAGNLRRIITVPVVQTLSAAEPMPVLAFRQFVIMPNTGTTTTNAADNNGRFVAMYIGAKVPLRVGSVAGCTRFSSLGPGKVALVQ